MATRLHWTAGDEKHGERSRNGFAPGRLSPSRFGHARFHEPRQRRALSLGSRLRRLASRERFATERDRRVHAPGRGRDSPPPRALPAILLHPDRRGFDGNQRPEHADPRRKWSPNPARNATSDPQSVLRPRAFSGHLATSQPRRPHRRTAHVGHSPFGRQQAEGAQPGRAESQLLPSNHPRRSQRPPQPRSPAACELHIQKSFHLPPEALPVPVPPDFFHARHAVHIQILHPHHFVQPEAPVSAAHAATAPLPAASRSSLPQRPPAPHRKHRRPPPPRPAPRPAPPGGGPRPSR